MEVLQSHNTSNSMQLDSSDTRSEQISGEKLKSGPNCSVKSEAVNIKNPFRESNVLYHFIDGFVIEESDRSFSLDRSQMLTNKQLQDIWVKQQELIAKENEEKLKENETGISHTKGEYATRKIQHRCEFCGVISFQPHSARFCSLLCSRRHNASNARQYKLKSRRLKLASKNAEKMYSCKTPPLSPIHPCIPSIKNEYGENVELDISEWSVDQVCEYIESLPDSKSFSCDFRNHEIDGSALLLIKEDHLISTLNIKLGPALKLCSHIRKLQDY